MISTQEGMIIIPLPGPVSEVLEGSGSKDSEAHSCTAIVPAEETP